MPITLTEAILGTTKQIPTLYGTENVEIKAGTQYGNRKVLVGKGLKFKGSVGNQIITYTIEIPVNLSEDQKKLVSKLDTSLGKDNYRETESFFQKIRNFFK